MTRRGRRLAALVVVALAGCGAGPPAPPRSSPAYLPLSVGAGPRYRPPAGPAAAAARGLGCRTEVGRRSGVHVELFAHRHVVVVPAGIGVIGARRVGAYVRGGRCFGPLITLEPTGVVEAAGRALHLGDLFAAWGQPLGPRRLAGFAGGVRAYVGGRRVVGDPAAIGLRAHAEIVLEIDGFVPPHRSYRFAGGL